MKKKLLALAAIATGAVVLTAAPSSAAAELCYDVEVNVNGTAAAQAGCIPVG